MLCGRGAGARIVPKAHRRTMYAPRENILFCSSASTLPSRLREGMLRPDQASRAANPAYVTVRRRSYGEERVNEFIRPSDQVHILMVSFKAMSPPKTTYSRLLFQIVQDEPTRRSARGRTNVQNQKVSERVVWGSWRVSAGEKSEFQQASTPSDACRPPPKSVWGGGCVGWGGGGVRVVVSASGKKVRARKPQASAAVADACLQRCRRRSERFVNAPGDMRVDGMSSEAMRRYAQAAARMLAQRGAHDAEAVCAVLCHA